MKKMIVSMLAVLALSIGLSFAPVKKAHASIFLDIAIATYVYHHRAQVHELFEKAKAKTHSASFPHFKIGASHGSDENIEVVTKHHTENLGAYPKKLVETITHADGKVKAELNKLK